MRSMKNVSSPSIAPHPLNASFLYSSDEESDGESKNQSSSSSSISENIERESSYEIIEEKIVTSLSPHSIRWFYKENSDKKWIQFSGYDSLCIEQKYEELSAAEMDAARISEIKNPETLVDVRNGLYEVDVTKRRCTPIYWTPTNAGISSFPTNLIY